MSTLSLLGSCTFEEIRKIWKFNGVIYFDSPDSGSNINLETSPCEGPLMTTVTNKQGQLNLTDTLTFKGKVLPLCKSNFEEEEDIKLCLSLIEGYSRVEASMTSSILGDLTLFGSITQFGQNWDLAVFADLEESCVNSYFKRKNTWKHGLGMGKRLRVTGFHESPPEPTFFRYEYLSNHQVRIIWQLPIHIEGQVVCMRLVVKRAHNSRNKKTWNVPKKNELSSTEAISTDRLGKKEITGHLLCVTFAPIALRSDDKYEDEGQYYAFYRNSTHSFVIDNLDIGEYECSMTVETLQSTLDASSCPLLTNFEIENHFPPFYVHPPPTKPSNLSVLLQKTKSNECISGEPDIYEPFIIVSWKPPVASRKPFDKLKKNKEQQGGPADGFTVSVEVFNLVENCWQSFGEPTITEKSCLKSGLDKESCVLVALPETADNSKTQLYSKFRVLVSSFSKFGQSEPLFSNNMAIPKYFIDKQTDVVNFSNLEEADCVICMENTRFSQRYNDLRSLCPTVVGEDPRVPINGLIQLDQDMFTCPVTPTCCSHVFHLKCLLDWCKKSRERQTRDIGRACFAPKCPLCMQKFKHIISQVLDPDLQCKRQLFCATTVIKKPELWTSLRDHYSF